MRVAVGCDHRGYPYRADVITALRDDGHEVIDCGTTSTEPVDYPDFARRVGLEVRDGRADAGVLICGSGAGVSIAANKIRGVRAVLCHDSMTARQAREDDDANVICMGSRVVNLEQAIALMRTFLGARFSGAERHARRVAKVLALERDEAVADSTDEWAEAPPVAAALERLARARAGEHIWRRNPALWSDDSGVQGTIANRLGWLDAPGAMRRRVADLEAFAADVRGAGITDVVLLGMGGSSLAAEVFARTFTPPVGAPTLAVLDTTDPGAIRATLARLKLSQTLFLVSSKSGTTVETAALYRFFRAEVERQVERAGEHFVAITDAGTPLERLAAEGQFRRTFVNAPDIGGRFSALSYFGLVPGALAGVDVGRLLERALAAVAACGPTVSPADNPALRLGAVLGGLAGAARDKVTLVLSERVRALGAWLEQLLTESTGKEGRGLVVVNDETPAPPAAYGDDRVFVGLAVGGDGTVDRALAPLRGAGQPVVRLALGDAYDVGAEFFRWELATAAAGFLLGINPFDEPNVAQAKAATQSALATFRERGRLPDWPAEGAADVARVLRQARPGDYVAILAYLTPDPATTASLQSLRTLVRDSTRLATTLGYGPRYLHSTGQLHKGGPPTPILLILAAEDSEDLAIPGERYGFGTLKMAQALGDLATLRAAQRRALWLPIQAPPSAAIDRLRAALERSL